MDKLLGKKAIDKITGFEGIIIGKCEYLYGCNQYGITPMAKDGKIEETRWFDEGRVDVVGEGYSPESVKGDKNGGSDSDAPKGVY